MSTREAVARYVRAPKTVALVVATVLSIVAAYATVVALGSQLAFLTVIVLGVSVPATLDSYGLLPDAYGRVVGWTIAACLAHWVVFLPLFLGAVRVTGELLAAAVAFVLTVVASAVVGRSLQG